MDEISKLLEQATTPLERAILLRVMEQSRTDHEHALLQRELTASVQKLADSFAAHRDEFIVHRKEFAIHVTEEGQLLTWGLRVFSATCAAVLLVSGLGGAFVVRYVLDVNERQQITIDTNSNRLTSIEAILRVHDRAKTDK